MNVQLNIDWKFVAAIGFSVIGGIIASKVPSEDAKDALVDFSSSITGRISDSTRR